MSEKRGENVPIMNTSIRRLTYRFKMPQKGKDRRDMILGSTEGYFSKLEDADKRAEKRKIKNQSSKNGSLNQINCII